MNLKLKIITLLLAMCCLSTTKAENVLQVVPFQTTPGLTSDDACCFQINLNNEEPVWGLQFTMKLPDGITLDADAFEIFNENKRFPSRRGGRLYHSVDYNVKDGLIYVVITNLGDYYIQGTEGTILNVYYLTDPNLKPGLYPIEVSGTVFVFPENQRNDPPSSTSYVYVGESPIKTGKTVNLSCLSGYIPSFVMDEVNLDLAANNTLQSVDFTKADLFGKMPIFKNPNTLCYIDASSQNATETDNKGVSNMIKKGVNDYSCKNLNLNEDYPFSCANQVTVEKASISRGPVSSQWNSICFPFNLTQEQIEATYGAGSYIQTFNKFENNSLHFGTDPKGYTGNQPSIMYVPEAISKSQYDFGAVTLLPTSSEPSIEINGACFKGNYEGTRSAAGLFGVTTDSKIMKGGTKAQISGFKAFFEIPNAANANMLRIYHDGITAIEEVKTEATFGNVYTIDGKCLLKNVNLQNVQGELAKGIYIINGKKAIIK